MDSRRTLDELSAAVLQVAAHRSVRDVLQTIVGTARTLLDSAYAALGVPDEQGGFAEFVVDGVSAEQWAAIGPLPRQHGMLGVMLSDPAPQRLPDLRADPRFGWWPPAHPMLKAFLGVPIVDGDEILGAIYLANPNGRSEFTEDDQRLLGVLAAHAAIALTNARLFEQGRELTLVQERQRIARELHDAVAQTLFSLRLTAQAAAALVPRDPQRALAELDTVTALATEATNELRQIVAELRPPELSREGLAATLGSRVALLNRVHASAIEYTNAGCPKLAPKVEEAMLRVAEEALHNALQHAHAKHVRVALHGDDTHAELEVIDDGRGFDVGEVAASHRLGLASMRERSHAVRGRLTVESAPDKGTTVRMVVPIGVSNG
ncbi:MAG TPA: GAF domain-containing sensor histidine kinase [Micromonosporaceae bacterium]|nr:GAF domain-containing sensor histidine kinase [Micromonosporaceae bacterium]